MPKMVQMHLIVETQMDAGNQGSLHGWIKQKHVQNRTSRVLIFIFGWKEMMDPQKGEKLLLDQLFALNGLLKLSDISVCFMSF